MVRSQHLYEVAEMVYEGQVPCVLRCDLVLARQLQAVVEEGPDLAPIKPLSALLLGAPAWVPRHFKLCSNERSGYDHQECICRSHLRRITSP